MNRFQKRIIKFITALGCLSFAMITAAVGTVAWFMASARKDATGMSIEAESPDISLNYDIYKYDFNNDIGVKYHNDGSKFNLPKYEILLPETQKELKNVIIQVNASSEDFSTSAKELQFIITRSDDYPYIDGETGKVLPGTSNIAQFKCIVHEYLPAGLDPSDDSNWVNVSGVDSRSGSATDDSVYHDATIAFNKVETPTTFVSVNGEHFHKSQKTITITPFLPQSETADPLLVDSFSFFIECSYNERLLNNYLKSYETEIDNGDLSFCSLNGDVTKIQIKENDYTSGTSNSGKYVRLTSNYNVIDSNYLAVYRQTDSATMGKVLDGSVRLNSELGSTIDTEIQSNSIVASHENNAASLKYTNDDEYSDDYHTLKTSKYRKNASGGYTYSDSNVDYIGSGDGTTGMNRNSTKYMNDININSLGKAELNCVGTNDGTSITEYTNPTTMYYNTSSGKYNYYASNTFEQFELYRYSENADSIGTLLPDLRNETPGGGKTKYYASDNFSRLNGLKAEYTDGGKFNVSDVVVYYATSFPGKTIDEIIHETTSLRTVTVTADYTEYNDRHATFTYNITINPVSISSVEVGGTYATEAYSYSTPDYTGLKARYIYNDGSAGEWIEYPNNRLTITNNNLTDGKWVKVTSNTTKTCYVTIDGYDSRASFTVVVKPLMIGLNNPTNPNMSVGDTCTVSITSSSVLAGHTVQWSFSDPSKVSNVTSTSGANAYVTFTGASAITSLTITATLSGTSYTATKTVSITEGLKYVKMLKTDPTFATLPFTTTGTIDATDYLFVYESGTTAYIWNGADKTQNYVTATLDTSQTRTSFTIPQSSKEDFEDLHLNITNEGSTVYVRNTDGNYVTNPSSGNYGIRTVSSKTSALTFNMKSDNTFYFGSEDANTWGWACYTNSTYPRFEYMKNAFTSNCYIYRLSSKSDIEIDDSTTQFEVNDSVDIPFTFKKGSDGLTESDILLKVNGVLTSGCISNGKITWIPTSTGSYTLRLYFNSQTNTNYDEISITAVPSTGTKYTLTISGSDFTTSYGSGTLTKTATAVGGLTTSVTINYKNILAQNNKIQIASGTSNGLYNTTALGKIQSVTYYMEVNTANLYYGNSSNPSSGTESGKPYFSIRATSKYAKLTTAGIVIVFKK